MMREAPVSHPVHQTRSILLRASDQLSLPLRNDREQVAPAVERCVSANAEGLRGRAAQLAPTHPQSAVARHAAPTSIIHPQAIDTHDRNNPQSHTALCNPLPEGTEKETIHTFLSHLMPFRARNTSKVKEGVYFVPNLCRASRQVCKPLHLERESGGAL